MSLSVDQSFASDDGGTSLVGASVTSQAIDLAFESEYSAGGSYTPTSQTTQWGTSSRTDMDMTQESSGASSWSGAGGVGSNAFTETVAVSQEHEFHDQASISPTGNSGTYASDFERDVAIAWTRTGTTSQGTVTQSGSTNEHQSTHESGLYDVADDDGPGPSVAGGGGGVQNVLRRVDGAGHVAAKSPSLAGGNGDAGAVTTRGGAATAALANETRQNAGGAAPQAAMNAAQTNAGGAQTLGTFGSEEEDEEDEDGGNGVMVAEFDTLWGWGPSDFQLVFVRADDGTIHVFFVDHGMWGDHGAVYLGVYDPVSKIVTNDGNRQLMRDVVEKGSEGGDQDDWDDWFAKNPLTRGPTRGNMLNGTADANGGRPFEPLIHNPDPAHEDTARGWTDVAEGLAEFGVNWYEVGAGLVTAGTGVAVVVGMSDDAGRFGRAAKTIGDLIEDHHQLPRQFKDKFARVGLDIEDFVIRVDKTKHRLKPNGLHTNEGGNWNRQWKNFFDENKFPTREQVLDHLGQMRRSFGLE